MNQRPMVMCCALLAACWAAGMVMAETVAVKDPAATTATDLRTDYRVNPLGIDRLPPRHSWKIESGGRPGARQKAYQIQSASGREALLQGQGTLWDSGKVASAQNTQIVYGGPRLESRQRVWWRVKLWDEAGQEGPWSAPAWFETALLRERDWQGAEWVGCTREYQAPETAPEDMMGPWIKSAPGLKALSFYKEIPLPDKPVVSAMAWWGTSRPTSAAVLANYHDAPPHIKRVLDRVRRVGIRKGGFIDLAFYMKPGQKNRVDLVFDNAPKAVAATIGMRIVFADGEELLLKSGPDWTVNASAKPSETGGVTVADNYGGARLGRAAVLPKTCLAPAWFRRAVNVKDGLVRGRLYLCVLGCGIPYLNGTHVGDAVLSPPQSDYEELAFYTTHDITRLLKTGPNALAVLLDAGWYHQVGGFGGAFYGRPGLKALVALDYADGKTDWVAGGAGWQWKEGAIRAANVYRGEQVDYRRDHEEWQRPEAGDGWRAAPVLPPLSPTLLALDVAPVRPIREIKPVRRWRIGPKTWMFDAGEVLHGWVRLNLSEPAGATVRIRFTEAAAPGEMWNVPVSQWWCHGVSQGDLIVADGKPRRFEPQFTTKSFRYFEISGLSREPGEGEVAAVLVHTDAQALAEFESADPLLNRLFTNGMRTHRNYLSHMFADIPRERCLWGAESIYSWATAFNCFDWAPNHRLMARLWFTGQMTPDGIPGSIGVGKRGTGATGGLVWSISPLFITAKMFEQYGDAQPAAEFYEKIRHFLDYAKRTAKDGVLPKNNRLHDHAPAYNIERNPANGELISALAFFDAQLYFARLAERLGKADDAAQARAHAEKIRVAIMKFYDPDKHTFGNGTHDSLALAYGVMREPDEPRTLAAAMAGYYRANGHKFDGGFMTYELYPMLSRHGYVDDALQMLRNPDCPGPAWSIKKYDATTYWERYFGDDDVNVFNNQLARGFNFFAFAHPTAWMITDLAGIRPDPAVPGGSRLLFAPAIPKADPLEWVRASLITAQGTARSAWKRSGGNLEWEITVPPNTTAEIRVPTTGGASVRGVDKFKPLGVYDEHAIYEAGPGEYEIHASL